MAIVELPRSEVNQPSERKRKEIEIILVDDDQLTRAGIRLLIERIPRVSIVGEAANGREALSMIMNAEPDVVLVDVLMPRLNGIELASRVTQENPQVHILMLTASTNEDHLWMALYAHASGYLLKDSSVAELEIAIQAVVEGYPYITPRMLKPLLRELLETSKETPFTRLTSRQREVLQLIAEGKTTKEIAVQLNLSVKAIEKHRTDLMWRLDIHNVAELVRYAMSHGILH